MLSTLRFNGRRRLFGLVAVLALAGAGVAYATIPGSDGAIHGCYGPDGSVRLIDTDAGKTCRAGEKAIAFGVPVKLGCPAGTQMFVGVCVETAERSPAIILTARQTCAAAGRRLPTAPELFGFRDQPGVTLPNVEWADDLGDVTLQTTFVYVVMDDGNDAVRSAFTPAAYRCVAGPVLQ